jgi:hypothetical protein
MGPRDGRTMSRDAVNQLNGTSTSSIVVTMLTLSSREGAGPAADVEANAHRAQRPGTQHVVDARTGRGRGAWRHLTMTPLPPCLGQGLDGVRC